MYHLGFAKVQLTYTFHRIFLVFYIGINLPVSLRRQNIYNKQHKCFYCKDMQSKLARHLQRKHSTEDEVSMNLVISYQRYYGSSPEDIRLYTNNIINIFYKVLIEKTTFGGTQSG